VLFNAHASIKAPNNLELGIYGKNLANKIYYNNAVGAAASFGVDLAYYGAPRTFGVELKKRF
jgi:iron complex outermembrane recepter protein